MGKSPEKHLEIINVDKADLWATLEWQQTQIHHYQLVSRGILGLLIAISTGIIAALTTPLLDLPKSIPTDYSPVNQAVSGMPIGPIAGRIIISMSILLLFILILWTFLTTIIAGKRFGNVLFDHRIKTGLEPNKERILLTSVSALKYRTQDSKHALNDSVRRNQLILDQITTSFLSALVRLLLALSITLTAFLLHNWIVDFEMWALIYINIFPLVPVQYTIGIPARLARLSPMNQDPKPEEDSGTGSILQPYIDAYDETTGESIFSTLMTVFNMIVAVSVAFSFIYSLLS